jgi:hypothetical protein
MSLEWVISNTLINRIMFSITNSITKVLISTFGTIVIPGMAFDTIRNSVSDTDNRLVDWVSRHIEHIFTARTY